MRKRITPFQTAATNKPDDRWLDVEQIATVEVSSEESQFPVESALRFEKGPGWRSANAGEQQIRLIFDQPVSLRRIHLLFNDREHERTQEFTLKWYSAEGGPAKEIVRQQWNFNPSGSVIETEDYAVNLDGVSVLELAITPDISRRAAVASLTEWRMA
jgi:hypothetical protein